MDLHTVKFGLTIAACGMAGIILFFALYVKIGERAQRDLKKN